MVKFTIKPHDVLFFGSGKPFNVGSNADSIFPPFPHSFASSVYAKLYSETKIEACNGKLAFKNVYGPFIQKGDNIYFPAPVNLMKRKKEEINKIYVSKPCDMNSKLINPKNTDLGEKLSILLWVKSNEELEPFNGFISLEGLKDWYEGKKEIEVKHLLKESDVYITEERISIYLEDETRTVKEEDGLFRVKFIRLNKDFKFVFWIEADFSDSSLLREKNINNDDDLINIFQKGPKILKLGGESRTAGYEVEKDDFNNLFTDFSFSMQKTNNSDKYKFQILFLTDGVCESDEFGRTVIECFNGQTKVLGGAISGYYINGINSKYYKEYSKRTVRSIKPGSMLYLEDSTQTFSKIITFFKPNRSFIGSNLVLVKQT